MDDRLREMLQRGRELYEKKDYAHAEPLLEQVIASGVGFADVYDMLGVMAHMRGALKDARVFFEKAVQINPNYTDALLNLAVALNDLRDYEAAKEIFDRLNNRAANTPGQIEPYARGKIANMHADTSQAYAELGMTIEAIEEMQKAVTIAPTFADLRVRLGLLYRDAGDSLLARREFEAAIHVNPRYVKAYVLLGSTELALGRQAQAEAAWSKALEIDPENTRAKSFLEMLKGQQKALEKEDCAKKGLP